MIDGLPALQYYDVLAYPQEDNPERVTLAHAEPVPGCGPNRLDYASGVMKKVFLQAGQHITNVDPASYYTRLTPVSPSPRDNSTPAHLTPRMSGKAGLQPTGRMPRPTRGFRRRKRTGPAGVG